MKSVTPALAVTAALLAGCGAATDADARATSEWVLSAGGTVHVSTLDRELKSIDELPDEGFAIVGIRLNNTMTRDADLAKLSSLQHLRTLSLHRTSITDAGIDALLPIKSLQELELSYTQITDQGLNRLAELPRLEKLFLYGTAVTEQGLQNFREARSDVTILR